jgi:hypothetical protein
MAEEGSLTKAPEAKKKPYEKPVIIERSGMYFPREIIEQLNTTSGVFKEDIKENDNEDNY